jgi:FkbM family methyltransferase
MDLLMKFKPQKLVRQLLESFNIHITSCEAHQNILDQARSSPMIDLILALPEEHAHRLLKYIKASKAQFGQDLFVLSQSEFKTHGFFVEFGATDGVYLSNTYILEKELGWNGILAEPAKCWHENLNKNRKCHIETDCVWSSSHKTFTFNQSKLAWLSTITEFSQSDYLAHRRGRASTYDVNTISINDLLSKFNAPDCIDYLSIDTEGSEFEILNALNFNKYQIKIISCEHNHTVQRERIHLLLSGNGYRRILESHSGVDDWYILSMQ